MARCLAKAIKIDARSAGPSCCGLPQLPEILSVEPKAKSRALTRERSSVDFKLDYDNGTSAEA